MKGNSTKAIIADISKEHAFAHVKWLSEQTPQRHAGSDQCAAAADYMAGRMSEYGLDARVYEYDGLVSFPNEAELRVLSPVERDIRCNSMGGSPLTPAGGLVEELVYVGVGAESDYRGKNVRGKLVLAELAFHPHRMEKIRIAAEAGAAGIVQVNFGSDDMDYPAYGSAKQSWGNPTPETVSQLPKIPVAVVSRALGVQLRELCHGGPVRVRLGAGSPLSWRRLREPIGVLRGAGEPEKFVIIGGHLDVWSNGATDNATGNALTLEIARVLSRHRDKLRRSVVFTGWVGHETGTMTGSTWYADHFWSDLDENAVAYLQVDSIGMKGATIWQTSSCPELIRFHRAVEEEMLPGVQHKWRRVGKRGDQSFFALGIPAMAGLLVHRDEEMKAWGGAFLGWWIHTDEDTLDKVDLDIMEVAMRVNLRYILDLCQPQVLPMDFTAVAAECLSRVRQLQPLAEGVVDLGPVAVGAERLQAAAARLDALAKRLIEAQKPSKADVARVNRTLQRLSRILTPALTTVSGRYAQDPYGLSALEKPLPGLGALDSISTFRDDRHEYNLQLTGLVRQRNRIADALKAANELIDATV